MWKLLGLMALSASAGAQTFDYTGAPITGTLVSLQSGATDVTASAVTGFLSAEVVLTNGVLASYAVAFNVNGAVIALDPSGRVGLPSQGPVWDAGTGIITQDGAGFDMAVSAPVGPYMAVNIGASDQFSYLNGGSNGTCQNQLNGSGAPYAGPSVAICSVQASGSKGTWALAGAKTASVSAPEIDPKGAMGAFLLLAGGLAVLRGRR